MLNPIDPQSGTEEIVRGNIAVVSLNQSSPAQIVTQVAGGDAVEAAYPFLESAIVGIDVLHMIDPRHNTLTSSQIDRPVGDAHFFGNSRQRLFSVGAQNDSVAKSGLSTAPRCALSAFSRMKSAVLPVRSRQIRTAVCSSDRPRLLALPPRLRGARLKPCLLPFCDSRKYVSSGSAMPARLIAC